MPGFARGSSCEFHKRVITSLAGRAMDQFEAEEKFQKGLDQFNHGHFFEAHETWEEIWLSSPEPEKTFLQGIIQVAAAFHHYTRSNRAGTESLLKTGLKKLEKFPARHRGVQLKALRADARRWIAALESGAHQAQERFPRIERVHRR